MTNGRAKWGIRLEIDFGQGSFNVIAGSVNWRSRIQVLILETVSGESTGTAWTLGKRVEKARQEKGVCEYHRTVILNRGSGGRGQCSFGFV